MGVLSTFMSKPTFPVEVSTAVTVMVTPNAVPSSAVRMQRIVVPVCAARSPGQVTLLGVCPTFRANWSETCFSTSAFLAVTGALGDAVADGAAGVAEPIDAEPIDAEVEHPATVNPMTTISNARPAARGPVVPGIGPPLRLGPPGSGGPDRASVAAPDTNAV